MRSRADRFQRSRRQSGATVTEYVLVLPFVFLLMYGTSVYGYVFFLNQSLNHAVQQAAASAVTVNPAAPDVTTMRKARINATVASALGWMNPVQRQQRLQVWVDQASTTCPVAQAAGSVKVELVYALRNPSWLFPVVNLGFGQIPPLPENLNVCATALIQSQT